MLTNFGWMSNVYTNVFSHLNLLKLLFHARKWNKINARPRVFRMAYGFLLASAHDEYK